MNSRFEYITTLEYRLKAASNEIAAFKSGEKYIRMEKHYWGIIRRLESRIKALEQELAKAHAETVTVRNYWFDVVNDVDHENQKEIKKVTTALRNMEKRAVKAEKQRDDALDKITLQRREIYRLGIELEEEKGRNKKLTAQLNHNYENSSIPSSMTMKKKKISNSREKTGRKQGAQTGHKGHGRKKQTPTETVILPAPQEALDNPDFKKTGKTIVKQLVGIHMVLDVTEYRADVYYNSKTGERVHAPFPAEDYNGIIVQDHEKTFYKYGSDHQECLAHVERYLKDSAENENGKSWSTMMRALLKEMIHYRNGLPRGEECSKEKINEFEARYLEIINTAKKEYEDEPPGDYYKEGFNLYKRMDKASIISVNA